jgi:murein DD-endopeptidase MepM/ murein hydrolase activator NlpD
LAQKRNPLFYNILIVPNDGSTTRSFNIRIIWLRILFTLTVLLFAALVFIGITYTRLVQTAIEYRDLKKNYQILVTEREKISGIVHDMQKLKAYKKKITQTLAGYVSLKRMAKDSSSIESPINAFSTEVRDGLGVSAFINSDYPVFPPLEGYITRTFELLGGDYNHYGIDIAAPVGAPVRAAGRGVVIFTGWTRAFGNTVIILHRNGFHTHYSHLRELMVKTGEEVTANTVIGTTGNTGQRSSGVHLHFELWHDDVPLNPQKMITQYSLEGKNNGS